MATPQRMKALGDKGAETHEKSNRERYDSYRAGERPSRRHVAGSRKDLSIQGTAFGTSRTLTDSLAQCLAVSTLGSTFSHFAMSSIRRTRTASCSSSPPLAGSVKSGHGH